MKLPQILDGTYGQSTTVLQTLLAEAAGLAWFPRTDRKGDAQVIDLCRRALRRLNELFPTSAAMPEPRIEIVVGSLGEFDVLTPAVGDTDGSRDPMALTRWGRRLHQVAQDVRLAIETTPELHALVLPPLWPHEHRFALGGCSLYDDPPPPDLRALPRWAMLAHVQHNFQHTLEWALALPGTMTTSPSYLIWQCHRQGYYPLGLLSGRFLIFTVGNGEAE